MCGTGGGDERPISLAENDAEVPDVGREDADIGREFRQPDLLDEHGIEVPHLYDFLTGLLDWDPEARLGGRSGGFDALQADPYWKGADWELVGSRR